MTGTASCKYVFQTAAPIKKRLRCRFSIGPLAEKHNLKTSITAFFGRDYPAARDMEEIHRDRSPKAQPERSWPPRSFLPAPRTSRPMIPQARQLQPGHIWKRVGRLVSTKRSKWCASSRPSNPVCQRSSS